ncbi:MAG: glycosyltransferase [Myxococcales bacterium]|nr:glycosyltransferase [Myxococcales bacterium]MDH5307106.1 glycosyltransferase [Myxococcales bacterium]MDH5565037.1 glycosyltransferase [Myxococcales bacterium]
MEVSICIASQRPHGLARLLESIGRLKRPPRAALEVVVVGNGPAASGALRQAAASAPLDLPLRLFLEPRRNLSHVRNRAVEHATGRWIAFVDDDEVPREDWLVAYWSMLESSDADGYFGPVLPRLEPPASAWLDASFFARERFASGTWLGARGARTGNAFVKRMLFADVAFDPAFGCGVGEDLDLFRRMQRRGARFVWCDEAQVEEFVPPERQCLSWLARRAFEGGASYARVEARVQPHRLRPALRALAGLAAAFCALPFALLLGPRRAARAWLRGCVQAGKLHGLRARHATSGES